MFVSGFIGARNLQFKLNDVKRLIQEGVETITPEKWASCCARVEKTEAQYWAIDIAKDEEEDPVIIDLQSDSDVSCDDELTDTASETGETTDTADECEML